MRLKERGLQQIKVKDSTISRESGPTFESKYLWCLLTDLAHIGKGENGNRKSEKCLETNLMKPQNRLLGAVLRSIAI